MKGSGNGRGPSIPRSSHPPPPPPPSFGIPYLRFRPSPFRHGRAAAPHSAALPHSCRHTLLLRCNLCASSLQLCISSACLVVLFSAPGAAHFRGRRIRRDITHAFSSGRLMRPFFHAPFREISPHMCHRAPGDVKALLLAQERAQRQMPRNTSLT